MGNRPKKKTVRTLTEITLLNDSEFMHIETRRKKRFEYPLHKHTEIELNFIENYHGLRRVIGDSIEDCMDGCELVLVGPGLEHCWEESPTFTESDTYEMTIQFSPKLFDGGPFTHANFSPFVHLLHAGRQGIIFSPASVQHVRPLLDDLSHMKAGFYRFQKLMSLLYELSRLNDYRKLATESFTRAQTFNDNQRIEHVVNYIHAHYTEPIRLDLLSEMAYMSPTAFSSFFRLRTHKTVSDYIVDERIGHAIRLLVDSNKSILEICYASGFQNVSNFNRLFKKRRGCTPSQYRNNYKAAQTAYKSQNNPTCTQADLDEQRAEIRPK